MRIGRRASRVIVPHRHGFGRGSDVQDHDATRWGRDSVTAAGSASAVMPEIDHRIGECLECVV
jgi:hypothetical protein